MIARSSAGAALLSLILNLGTRRRRARTSPLRFAKFREDTFRTDIIVDLRGIYASFRRDPGGISFDSCGHLAPLLGKWIFLFSSLLHWGDVLRREIFVRKFPREYYSQR